MESIIGPQFLHNPKAAVSTVGYGDDTGVHVQFDDDFVKNEYKSEIEGRSVYDHYFVVELLWPGNNLNSYKYRFTPEQGDRGNDWTKRFPRQWEAFRASKEQTPDGTPIEMWPPLDKKRVFELKAMKIFTVEQIAAVKDTDLQSALGLDGRKMRDQAVAFLNPAASTIQVSKLSRENEDLKHQMAAMQLQLNALASPPSNNIALPKKRGRKPKLVTEAA
jgi:hypothetical protein